MIKLFKLQHLSAVLALLVAGSLHAQPKLPALFTDNMVLQQQAKAPVWGWSKAGKTITVKGSWNNRSYRTQADGQGKWKVFIETPRAGGPYKLSISDGRELTLNNVLIGEVWLCTGQSNMEMPVKGFRGQPILGANDAILESANNNIHLYTVPRASTTTVQDDSRPAQWQVAGPESVANFSASGYFFGRLLNKMLHVPVGLITVSYGGSTIEAWMDKDILRSFKEIKVPGRSDTIPVVNRTPTTLYNAMMHPVIGYAIKGCIWYQGESNYERPDQYEKLFPTMVSRLREQWGQGNFPFYYMQIAPYNYAQLPPYNQGGKYNSAYLRDAQRKSEAKIPNSAMAVNMDNGEESSIHPMRKEVVGKRLALLALAKTYGMKGFGYASPAYESMAVNGSVVTLKFSNVDFGLTTFGKEPSLFEIAGKDKVFYPAQAHVNAKSVSLSSPMVKEPAAVRYAFRDFVTGELFGCEGLPVSSFRTDDW